MGLSSGVSDRPLVNGRVVHHRVHCGYVPSADVSTLMTRHRIAALANNPFLVHLGERFVASRPHRHRPRPGMHVAMFMRRRSSVVHYQGGVLWSESAS